MWILVLIVVGAAGQPRIVAHLDTFTGAKAEAACKTALAQPHEVARHTHQPEDRSASIHCLHVRRT